MSDKNSTAKKEISSNLIKYININTHMNMAIRTIFTTVASIYPYQIYHNQQSISMLAFRVQQSGIISTELDYRNIITTNDFPSCKYVCISSICLSQSLRKGVRYFTILNSYPHPLFTRRVSCK
jgi:hypothetical protein